MAHQILKNDGLYLAGKPAWHGLGTVVEEAVGPTEAMEIAKLDWTVSKRPVHVDGKEQTRYKAVRRDDTEEIFGICASKYGLLQNSEFFDLAYALGDEVKVETAGSLLNGRKLFLLLRVGSVFEIGKADEVVPYISMMTSHDSSLSLSALPTSVRVVCNNTLNLSISEGRKKIKTVKHTSNILDSIKSMKEILSNYDHQVGQFRDRALALNSTPVKSMKELVDFYSRAYISLYGEPKEGVSKEKECMNETINVWQTNFETEQMLLGVDANYWIASNSITKDIQHSDPSRKLEGWEERRIESNLFGVNDDKSAKIFNMALSLI